MALRSAPTPRRPEGDTGRLFAEYSDRIFGYCLRRLGSHAEAEDAVQTTFLCAHRALQRGVVPESESAWLFTIARNVCRWQQRTLSRRGRLSSDRDVDAVTGMQQAHGDEEDLLIGLREALASIPERQRHAFVLREWSGLSSREIGSQMGVSPPAADALVTRARRSLVRALTGVPRRPVLGLDFGSLLLKLNAVLTGGSAKAVATTAVAAGIAVGGVSVERALVDDRTAPRVPESALRPDVAVGPAAVTPRVTNETRRGAPGIALSPSGARPADEIVTGASSSVGGASGGVVPEPVGGELPAGAIEGPGSSKPAGAETSSSVERVPDVELSPTTLPSAAPPPALPSVPGLPAIEPPPAPSPPTLPNLGP